VNIQEFRDDDGGYLEWIVVNPAGYVLNIPRGLNPSDAKLHRASCWTIDPRRRQMTMTESYIKLCSLITLRLIAGQLRGRGPPYRAAERVCPQAFGPRVRRRLSAVNPGMTTNRDQPRI
jgi:hypothetical protein